MSEGAIPTHHLFLGKLSQEDSPLAVVHSAIAGIIMPFTRTVLPPPGHDKQAQQGQPVTRTCIHVYLGSPGIFPTMYATVFLACLGTHSMRCYAQILWFSVSSTRTGGIHPNARLCQLR